MNKRRKRWFGKLGSFYKVGYVGSNKPLYYCIRGQKYRLGDISIKKEKPEFFEDEVYEYMSIKYNFIDKNYGIPIYSYVKKYYRSKDTLKKFKPLPARGKKFDIYKKYRIKDKDLEKYKGKKVKAIGTVKFKDGAVITFDLNMHYTSLEDTILFIDMNVKSKYLQLSEMDYDVLDVRFYDVITPTLKKYEKRYKVSKKLLEKTGLSESEKEIIKDYRKLLYNKIRKLKEK